MKPGATLFIVLRNEAITVSIQTPIISARLYCPYVSPRRRRNTIELFETRRTEDRPKTMYKSDLRVRENQRFEIKSH